jgi:hypothetical protein
MVPSNEENAMTNIETDPKMPWNQRTFLDTFWKNAAFEKLAITMIHEMNEKRKDDKAAEQRSIELKRKNDESYVNTVAMLLGLNKGEK